MEFKGYQSTYLSSLPDPETTPLFRDNDSLYCLIAKCCATDPADRFQSADELRVQLLGVLREVVAKKRAGTALTSAASQLFETPAVTTVALDWSQLPGLRDDTSDAQHAWLTSLAPVPPKKRLEQLQKAPEETAEVRLWRARAALEADAARARDRRSPPRCSRPTRGSGGRCGSRGWRPSSSSVGTTPPRRSTRSTSRCPASWRPSWPWRWRARRATARRSPRASTTPAPRPTRRTSPPRRSGWRGSAPTSATPTAPSRPSTWCRRPAAGTASRAQLRAEVLLRGAGDDLMRLAAAMTSVDGAGMEPYDRAKLSARILGHALEVVTRKGPGTVRIGSYEAKEPSLRDGLEASYRVLAREAQDRDTQVLMVGRANAVRNWTLT